MLHKIISLKIEEEKTLSIQDYKFILLNLQSLRIDLFCQGSYVLHHALSQSITPQDIDIVGIYPNLYDLSQVLQKDPRLQSIRKSNFYIQFKYGDCDITIYQHVKNLGIGMSNYDYISKLTVTKEKVTLSPPIPKSNLTSYPNHSIEYVVYQFNESINIKGLYNYLYICLQLPLDMIYPPLAPIPEYSQFDEQKLIIYQDTYTTKLSKAINIPESLCKLMLNDYIYTTPLPKLHEKVSDLISKFKGYIKTYQLLETLLKQLSIRYDDLEKLFTQASFQYPYSKKIQSIIPSLSFANQSLETFTLELSKKLFSLVYQVPNKHILNDYFDSAHVLAQLQELLSLFSKGQKNPLSFTDTQCLFFNNCLDFYLNRQTIGQTIEHPDFISTQTSRITIVNTVIKSKKDPQSIVAYHTPPSSPETIKADPPPPSVPAQLKIEPTPTPSRINIARQTVHHDPKQHHTDLKKRTQKELFPDTETPSIHDLEKQLETYISSLTALESPTVKQLKKIFNKANEIHHQNLQEIESNRDLLPDYDTKLSDEKNNYFQTTLHFIELLDKHVFNYSKSLKKELKKHFSLWLISPLLCSADIDQLLQYGHLVELYPRDLFLDKLSFSEPSHHTHLLKLHPSDSFDIRFRESLNHIYQQSSITKGLRKRQKKKSKGTKSIELAPIDDITIHSISTYLKVKIPYFSSAAFEDIRARYLLMCLSEELQSRSPNLAFTWTLISAIFVHDQSGQDFIDPIQKIIQKHLTLDTTKLLKSIYYCFSNEQYERFMPSYYKDEHVALLSSFVSPPVTSYSPTLSLDQQFELIVSHSHQSYASLASLHTTWTRLTCSHHLLFLSYEITTYLSQTPVKIIVKDPKALLSHICLAYYHVFLAIQKHELIEFELLQSFHSYVQQFCTQHCQGSLDSAFQKISLLVNLLNDQTITYHDYLSLFYFFKSQTHLRTDDIESFFNLISKHYAVFIIPPSTSIESQFSDLVYFLHTLRKFASITVYISHCIKILKLDPKNSNIRLVISKWIKDTKCVSLLKILHHSNYDLRYYDTSTIVTNHDVPPILTAIHNSSHLCLEFFMTTVYPKGELPSPNDTPLLLSAMTHLNFNAARQLFQHTPLDFKSIRYDTDQDTIAHKVTLIPFSQDRFMGLCIDYLIEINCLSLLNTRNKLGETPIHTLFKNNQDIITKDFLSYLLHHPKLKKAIAYLNIQDNNGITPLEHLNTFLPTHPEREDILSLMMQNST